MYNIKFHAIEPLTLYQCSPRQFLKKSSKIMKEIIIL